MSETAPERIWLQQGIGTYEVSPVRGHESDVEYIRADKKGRALKKPKAVLKNMIALYGTHKFAEGQHAVAGAMEAAKTEQNTAHALLLEIERELDALFVLAEKGYA
jgi:hypothetical protein